MAPVEMSLDGLYDFFVLFQCRPLRFGIFIQTLLTTHFLNIPAQSESIFRKDPSYLSSLNLFRGLLFSCSLFLEVWYYLLEVFQILDWGMMCNWDNGNLFYLPADKFGLDDNMCESLVGKCMIPSTWYLVVIDGHILLVLSFEIS